MPPSIIADRSLGMQFWMTKDVKNLSETYNSVKVGGGKDVATAQNEAVSFKKKGKIVTGKANMSSLAIAGESSRLKNVMGKAKLLSDLCAGGKGVGAAANKGVNQDLTRKFCIDFETTALEIARLGRKYSSAPKLQPGEKAPKPPAGGITKEEMAFASRALRLTLSSREFTARAADSRHPIGDEARLALVNASLGIMNMIRSGDLSDEAAADIIQGEVFDPSKPTDMLRLAVKTAQTARTQFVNAEQLDAACKSLVDELDMLIGGGKLDAAKTKELEDLKADLVAKKNELVGKRMDASKRLDVKFDAAGKRNSALKRQLKKVSNDMRAWRFDMDSATGRLADGSRMEQFRRKMDNVGRKGENRVSARLFDGLTKVEGEFSELLAKCRSAIQGPGAPKAQPAFATSEQTSAAACRQTHAANNYVRAFFNGSAKEAQFAAEVHAMFDPLVQNGGTKLVRFEAGAEAGGGVGVADKGATISGTAKFYQTAEITVKPGGGEVTVTYLTGGEAGVKAEANFGITEKTSLEGTAEANVGGARGRTVKYASLDDFIRDTHGRTDLTKGFRGTLCCASWFKNRFQALGRGIRSLLERTGLAMKRQEIVSSQNRVDLQKGGTITKLDTMLSGQISGNAVKTSEKSYDVFRVGGNVEGSLSFGVGSIGGGFGLGYDLERRVEGREAQAFLTMASQQTDEWIGEACRNVGDDWKIANLETADSAESFRQLETLIGKLRDDVDAFSASPHDEAEVKERGRQTCAVVRDLAVQYEAIVRGMKNELAEAQKGGEADRAAQLKERIALADSVYGSQLRSTDFGIPQDVFEEELMVGTGDVEGGYARKQLDFSFSYDLTTGLTGGIVGASTGLAPAEGDSLGTSFLKSLGQTTEAVALTNALGSNGLGLAGKVEAVLTKQVPKNENADRPWLRQSKDTVSVRVSPSLPFRVILEQTAGKYLEHRAAQGAKNKTQSAGAMAKEMGMQLLMGILPASILKPSLSTLGKWMMTNDSLADVVKKVLEWNAQNGVQIAGFDPLIEMEKMKNVDFHFTDGRYEGLSLGNYQSMKSTVGVKLNAGVVKAGVHIASSYAQTSYTRTLFDKPRLSTLLGKAAEYARTGENGKLDNFLSQNAEGALRMLDAYRDRGPEPKDDKHFKEDGQDARKLVAEAKTALDGAKTALDGAKAALKTASGGLKTGQSAERRRLNLLDGQVEVAAKNYEKAVGDVDRLLSTATTEEKLAAFGRLLKATAQCYELGHALKIRMENSLTKGVRYGSTRKN